MEMEEVVKKKVEVRVLSYIPSSPAASSSQTAGSNKAENEEEEEEDGIVVVEEDIEAEGIAVNDRDVVMTDEEPAPIESQFSDAMQY